MRIKTTDRETETCYGCEGTGRDKHSTSDYVGKCLHCGGTGEVPAGYKASRKYVFSVLAHTGALYDRPSEHEVEQAWSLADGFGEGAQHEWDWSHVRDSSPFACIAMAEYLRRLRLEERRPG